MSDHSLFKNYTMQEFTKVAGAGFEWSSVTCKHGLAAVTAKPKIKRRFYGTLCQYPLQQCLRPLKRASVQHHPYQPSNAIHENIPEQAQFTDEMPFYDDIGDCRRPYEDEYSQVTLVSVILYDCRESKFLFLIPPYHWNMDRWEDIFKGGDNPLFRYKTGGLIIPVNDLAEPGFTDLLIIWGRLVG